MINYDLNIVKNTLEEVCKKFEMTKDISIKNVKYLKERQTYLVTLGDDSEHLINRDLINKYIETLGDKGGLKIAGQLVHSIELEESAPKTGEVPEADDYWGGNMNDVIDYLGKTKTDADIRNETEFLDEEKKDDK